MLRTHSCGELSKREVGKQATLAGWADHIRLHGKIGFINLRDRYGITQVVLSKELVEKVKDLKRESVLQVKGKVKARPSNLANKDMKTGEIELQAEHIEILNPAEPLPLELDEKIESTEETRLKYRYLDLRKPRVQQNLITRHRIIKSIRDYLDTQQFIEIETPILAKSTPEGARDYLVPSRIYPGKHFALPQSPQLFKQLLMVAGFDRYFQIARCFRDEDLRADRQPEFTQLDIEMSFIDEEDIFHIIEELIKHVLKEVKGISVKTPFPRMKYEDAMKKHKSDKPDLRKSQDELAFVWITDFPMFEYSQEEKRLVAMHHPFTSPRESDIKLLDKDPKDVKARAYDLVLNGIELGGGSIRIHNRDLQMKVFKALKLEEKEAKEQFSFLLDAMQYGNPPLGGIALGIDRMVAILTGNDSIREVIAFPKNKDARDLMMDAPSKVYEKQLKELGLKFK